VEQNVGGGRKAAQAILNGLAATFMLLWTIQEASNTWYAATRMFVHGDLIAMPWAFVQGFVWTLLSPLGWPALVLAAICAVASSFVQTVPPQRLGLAVLLLAIVATGFFVPFAWLPPVEWAFVVLAVAVSAVTSAVAFSAYAAAAWWLRVLAIPAGLAGIGMALLMPLLLMLRPDALREVAIHQTVNTPSEVMTVLGTPALVVSVHLSKEGSVIGTSAGCSHAETYCKAVLTGASLAEVKHDLELSGADWHSAQMPDGLAGEGAALNSYIFIILEKLDAGVGVVALKSSLMD